ncbi:snRNA-activating protein complex subunit 4 [Thomomys bottae]
MDIDAEREKITKEIKELERILDPSSSSIHLEVSESSLDSSDSEADSLPNEDSDTTGAPVLEGERWGEASNDEEDPKDKTLPEDPETCLQLNMVYQEVIREKLAEVSQLLAQNREQQEEIVWDLAGSRGSRVKEGKSLPPSMSIGHFMKPYFKDKATGVGPPANEDTREKAAQGIKAFEALLVTKWKHWEKALLRKSVVSDRLQRLLQPKLLKLEYLRQKQSRVSSEPETQVLEKQVREAEKEIQDINQLPEEVLLGNRLDSHDWEKISNINFEGGRSAEEIRKFWQSSEHPSINKQDWSTEEVQQLRAIAAKHGHLEWQLVAEELGTSRSAFQCLQKFQEHNPALKRKEWTEDEDRMLTQLVQEMRVGGHIPYRRIVYYMEGRDSMQLIYRWTKSLDPKLKKGFWAPEEDAKLLQAVAKYGEQDWFKIREEVPGRSDAQCRDRYLRRLHFSLKKGRWNAKEEAQLIELIEKYGVGHWAKIASELPHRSGSQCLSKWKIMVGRNQSLRRRQRRRRRPRRRVRWSSSSSSSSGGSSSEDTAYSSSSSSGNSSENSEVELGEPQGRGRVLLPRQYTVPDLDLWVPARRPSASQPQREDASSSLPKSSGAAPGRPEKVPATAPGGASSRVHGTIPRGTQYPHPPGTHPASEEESACKKERQKQPALPDSTLGPGPGHIVAGPHLKRLWQQRQRHTLHQRLLDRKLLLAVTPWVGDVTLPCTQPSRRSGAVQTHADGIRMQVERARLASTPVFTLFIQLLRIDTAGCMEVVGERNARPLTTLQPSAQAPLPRLLEARGGQEPSGVRSTPDVPPQSTEQDTSRIGHTRPGSCHTASASSQVPVPAPCGPRPKPKTVSELLREKRLRESRAKRAARGPVALRPQLLLSSPVVLQPSLPPATQGPPATCLTITNPALSGPGAPVVASASPSGSCQALAKDSRPASLQAVPLAPMFPGLQAVASAACSLPALGPSRGHVSCPPSSLPPPQAPALAQERSLPKVLPFFPTTPSPAQLLAQPLSLPPQSGSPVAASLPLPVTWVLTAPGLLPVPVPAVVGVARPVGTPDPAGLLATQPPPPAETPCLAPASRDVEAAPSSRTPPPSHLPSQCSTEERNPPCAPREAQGAGESSVPSAGHVEAEPPGLSQLPTQSAPGPRSDPGGTPGNSSGPLELREPEKGAVDLGLLSQESEAAVQKWLKGQRGAHVPQLESRLPYQPPALCNLRVLSSLLLHKKALELKAASLLASGAARPGAEPDPGAVQSSLGLVRKQLQDSPAYLLLKTRFLAAFALPAFLATLPPCGVPTTLALATRMGLESDEDTAGWSDCTASEAPVGPVAMSPTQGSLSPGKASASPQLDACGDVNVLRTRHAQHVRKRRRLP